MPRIGELYKVLDYEGRVKGVVMLRPRNIVEPSGPIVRFIDSRLVYIGALQVEKRENRHPIFFRSTDGKMYSIGEGSEKIYEIAKDLERESSPFKWKENFPDLGMMLKICESLSSCDGTIPVNDEIIKFSNPEIREGRIVFPLEKGKVSIQGTLEDFL